MKNQERNADSPKFTEQIIRAFGIDPAEIPSWETLSLGQLYAFLSRHPSLNELYEADANAERNRRMDVLDDLRAMWHYEEDGGAPTPDELKHYGEAAWAAIEEILQDANKEGRALLESYTLDIPTGTERWTPNNIRRATALLQIPLQHDWEGFSEVWDVMRFEILEGQLDTLVQRLDTQEMLTGRWKARPQNTMAETPVGALRRRISAELPPPGFFANEAEAQAFDAFQQAFGFFLDDAYAEKTMHALGVWQPSGAWYSGVNVKELDTYMQKVAETLLQTEDFPKNLTQVKQKGGVEVEIPHQTKQRALKFLKALQHYEETVGITASDDTHSPANVE
ncbi:MAG: hypothetical protein OXU27_04495 [Candidatus Poribacteria bacterium]|nr:hypothetical protein [Candidatus Poribacteria bacterium]MDD9973238.1 hypothetical protein [Candidatus Poribacteria bacterium]